MDRMKTLEQLCSLNGVSGNEDAVRDYLLERLRGSCTCTVDALGSITAFKKGRETPRNKIMLSAHMDEVGFIITRIEDTGMLRFATVGGIDSRVIVGRPVEIGDSRHHGVVGTKAIHHQTEKERETPLKVEQMYIDIGACNREEAEKLVSPGDRAVFSALFGRLGESKCFGRALDDRAGCALLLELLEKDLPWDVYGVFNTREEVGGMGAAAAAHALSPDIAIVLETTTAADIAGVEPDRMVCRQGEGPVFSFMDRGAVYDGALYRLAMETAREQGIPCQCKAGVYGMNDSHAIQPAGNGVRVLGMSLPCRYLHSPSCVLDLRDMEETARLLEALIPAVAHA